MLLRFSHLGIRRNLHRRCNLLMRLGPMEGFRLIRDTIFSRLRGGLSRCFLPLCCCWWFSSIRQYLQWFFVTIWISAVMFKSNEILRKQTTSKGERKISVLVGISLVFTLHVAGAYWWYHNDTLMRQTTMVFRCILLMHAISSSSPSLGVESMTDGHNNYTGCGYNDVFDEPAMGNGTYPSLFCPMHAIFLFNTTCLHTLSFHTHKPSLYTHI